MSEVMIAKSKSIATLQGMRDAAAAKLTQAEEMQAIIDAEDREWTAEEETQHGSLLQEASDLKKEYEFEQRRMQTEARRGAAAMLRQDFS